MRKIRRWLILVLIVLFFWYFYGDAWKNNRFAEVFDKIQSDITKLVNHEFIQKGLDTILKDRRNEFELLENNQIKPQLYAPKEQIFSIHNIEIGSHRDDVEEMVGPPKRETMNEYGVLWAAYHENYENFFMVVYDENDKVVAMYTDQDLLTSTVGITLGAAKEAVLQLGDKPLEYIRKGWVDYEIHMKDEYEIFLLEDQYVTIFYDTVEGNVISGILIVTNELEERKKDIYGDPSPELQEGFEYQLFDLTNSTRVKHGLAPLQWDVKVRDVARKHSVDMARNHFFDHTNLEGKSPFDRLKEEGVFYRIAGENIAMGQFSSIFAHNGLMNSLGHRQNILLPEFERLGVGVEFNEFGQPYYTENFLSY